MPAWLATLASARPDDAAEIGDPAGDAIERFLKWEADPARPAIAIAGRAAAETQPRRAGRHRIRRPGPRSVQLAARSPVRRADGYAALRSATALVPLLSYLRGLDAVLPPRMPAPRTPADLLAARFGEYLARERGLAGESIRSR